MIYKILFVFAELIKTSSSFTRHISTLGPNTRRDDRVFESLTTLVLKIKECRTDLYIEILFKLILNTRVQL